MATVTSPRRGVEPLGQVDIGWRGGSSPFGADGQLLTVQSRQSINLAISFEAQQGEELRQLATLSAAKRVEPPRFARW